MKPLLVLDTQIAKQAHEPTLGALRDHGYRLAICVTVIKELAARAYLGRGDKGPQPGLFFGPARRLARHLDGACPVTPCPPELTHIVVADGDERERLLTRHVAEYRAGWENLLKCSTAELLAVGKASAAALETTGEFSTRMNGMRGMAKGVDWKVPYAAALDWFDSDTREAERFNAMVCVQSLSVAKTAVDAESFRVRTPNDAPDLTLLGQVGLGAFVVTDDMRLLREVRASGTYQSPWIRTAAEYLAAVALPTCLPWGEDAKREAERFASD